MSGWDENRCWLSLACWKAGQDDAKYDEQHDVSVYHSATANRQRARVP